MSLPEQQEYEEMMYRAQRYIVVRGHAQEAGLPPEGTEAYEFNIKFDASDTGVNTESPAYKKVVQKFFEQAVATAKEIWPWIDDVKQVGRNGGWAVATIKTPGFLAWVQDYNDKEDTTRDKNQLVWMCIQHRIEDLDAISEFIADQQKTLKQDLPALVKEAK